MQLIASISALAALTPLVAAHGFVNNIVANGVAASQTGPGWIYSTPPPSQAGWKAYNQDNGFVASDATSLASQNISCHKGASAGGATVTAAAGSTVKVTWNTWPVSHKGPVINYLAKCAGSCTTLKDASSLSWFKIKQEGLINGDPSVGNGGEWATDTLIANNFSDSVTIPSGIAPGNYVLRHEILALHSAGSSGGAQFYPQCLNVVVTGSGTANPSGVAGPSLYKSNDPGVLINIYQTLTTYAIPGPTLYAGAAAAKRAETFQA